MKKCKDCGTVLPVSRAKKDRCFDCQVAYEKAQSKKYRELAKCQRQKAQAVARKRPGDRVFTDDLIIAIKRSILEGADIKAIAKAYETLPGNISNIIARYDARERAKESGEKTYKDLAAGETPEQKRERQLNFIKSKIKR